MNTYKSRQIQTGGLMQWAVLEFSPSGAERVMVTFHHQSECLETAAHLYARSNKRSAPPYATPIAMKV